MERTTENRVTISNLPAELTTEDMAELLNTHVEHVWKISRRNKDILKPYKLGRETRYQRENVEIFYSLLVQGKIN